MTVAPADARVAAGSAPTTRGPGPLVRRGLTRLWRSGGWGVLVAATLVLLAAAAAAPPMFTDAAGSAALQETVDAVPVDALTGDAPVVRVVSGSPPSDGRQQELAARLAAVPGLSSTTTTGASIGFELRSGAGPAPFAAGPAGTRPARVFADQSLADTLLPVVGGTAGGAGLWLPEPLATALGLTAGDPLEIGVDDTGAEGTSATTRVAGVYQVGADERRPQDPAGRTDWARRRKELPRDTSTTTLAAYLLIGDPATVEALAGQIGDDVLWSVEARLSPSRPTLPQARRTADQVTALGAGVVAPGGGANEAVQPVLVSGVPQLVAQAQALTERSQAWTAPLSRAGTVVGLAAVLAIGALGLSRRTVEMRVSAALGVHPVAQGGLAALELLVLAPAAVLAGVATGYGVVRVWGPPAPVTPSAVLAGAGGAAGAVALGVALTGLLAARAAAVAAAHVDHGRSRRTAPWELLLAVAATAGAVGLATRPPVLGPPGALDLLVPLLVLGAVAAVGARGLTALLGRARPSAATGRLRRPSLWLALRRAAGAGAERVLVVTLVATGLGMLVYSVSAATSVRTTIADRVAVSAGTSATATITGSWQLDPQAVDASTYNPDVALAADDAPRVPPLPADATVVWRARLSVAGQPTNVDVLAVDPVTFDSVALWGEGPELADARRALATLGEIDRGTAADLRTVRPLTPATVPAIAVASTLGVDDEISARSDRWSVPVRVTATAPAFPGHEGELPLLVVPADSFLLDLQGADPRLRTDPARGDDPPVFRTWLWSAGGGAGLDAVLAPTGTGSSNRTTVADAARAPDLVAAARSQPYSLALGACLAGLAVVVLALSADRTAVRSRAADVLLARVGLGRRGMRAARNLDTLVVVTVSLVLGCAAVVLLTPLGARLLDPGGGLTEPVFALRLGPAALLAGLVAAVVAGVVAATTAELRTRAWTDDGVLRDGD